jgi:hypothetical protein
MARGAPGAAPAPQPQAAPAPQAAPDPGAAYEYLTFYVGTGSTHGELATARLNDLGAQGWLLQAVGLDTMYFSRVVVPPEPPPGPTDPPVNVDVPNVSGGTSVGSVLSCTMGNWNNEPDSYAYQWKRGATNIGNGTANYTVVAADWGQNITCVVTATNVIGSTAAPPSNALAIPAPPAMTAAPVVSPTTAGVDDTLTSTTGTWNNTPTSYAYQWKRGATNVGTNAASYLVVAADAGSNITCVVTATNAVSSSVSSPSNAVAIPAV